MIFSDAANPIWDNTCEKDSWRIFASSFHWDSTTETFLEISAESTFEVLLNGYRIPVQQLSDFPDDRTFSSVKIDSFLSVGENHIRIIVHWNGENFSTSMAGMPYLWCIIHCGEHIFTQTDSRWKTSNARMYHSGLRCRVTPQLGFVYEYDARLEEDFVWKPAVELDRNIVMPQLRKRTVAQLIEKGPISAAIVQVGALWREKEFETFAQSCTNDWMRPLEEIKFFQNANQTDLFHKHLNVTPESIDLTLQQLSENDRANGYYITLDLQREYAGYFFLKLNASAGTVIDIAYGEHLTAGRVSASIGIRNFADRYICKEGINEFKFTQRRIAGRFIELHITHIGKNFQFCYAGICPVELPLPERAVLDTEDRTLKRLYDLSARSLHICMHEHYEDTPWREQSLYAYDSRNQILFGYYLWGNGKFAANSLELLGKTFDQNRYLATTAPRKGGLVIPIFTMVWITALKEYLLYTGDIQFCRHWESEIGCILDHALADRLNNGLCSPGNGKDIWNFCEWNGSLSEMKASMQAPYNLYLTEALRSAAKLCHLTGNVQQAEKREIQAEEIGKSVKKIFYDSKNGLFHAEPDDTVFYEHTQIIAMMQCVLSPEERGKILRAIMQGVCQPSELSAIIYFIDALMNGTPESRKYLFETLHKKTDVLLRAGADLFWETLNGCVDFGRAGSLSHAWGAFIPYFTGRYLLGITPLSPGFETFRVKIWCGNYTHLSGTVPTPKGFIHISWKLKENGLDIMIKNPCGLKAIIESYEEFPIERFQCN